jgi:hypothetical protein
MDTAMLDTDALMKVVFTKHLELAKHNNWEMLGLDNEQKKTMLEYLMQYFIKIEDYEVCEELQEQLKILNV